MQLNMILIQVQPVRQHNEVEKSAEPFLSFRCQNGRCKKLLGKMDQKNGVLHIESSRSGWWISVQLEKGTIKCKKCGNELYWDHKKLGEK